MKPFIPLTLIAFLVLLSSCTCTKNKRTNNTTLLIDNSVEKLIDSVVVQKVVVGTDVANYSYHFEIYPAKYKPTLQFKSVYFRDLKGDITIGKKTYVASLKPIIKDLQLSSNQSDEYQNELPKTTSIPFLLNDNECVVSYVNKDTIKFIKVTHLIENDVEK